MIFEKFKQIKAIVLDVDGVLTDGKILVNEAGEQLRSFHVKDGYAMQLAVKRGFLLLVITGGKSQGVLHRLTGLGIQEVHIGVANKVALLDQLLQKYQLSYQDTLFVGDDCPDKQCMELAEIAVAPADAVAEIKAIADYISPINGGQGVVRDIIEKVLRIQGQWFDDTHIKSV